MLDSFLKKNLQLLDAPTYDYKPPGKVLNKVMKTT